MTQITYDTPGTYTLDFTSAPGKYEYEILVVGGGGVTSPIYFGNNLIAGGSGAGAAKIYTGEIYGADVLNINVGDIANNSTCISTFGNINIVSEAGGFTGQNGGCGGGGYISTTYYTIYPYGIGSVGKDGKEATWFLYNNKMCWCGGGGGGMGNFVLSGSIFDSLKGCDGINTLNDQFENSFNLLTDFGISNKICAGEGGWFQVGTNISRYQSGDGIDNYGSANQPGIVVINYTYTPMPSATVSGTVTNGFEDVEIFAYDTSRNDIIGYTKTDSSGNYTMTAWIGKSDVSVTTTDIAIVAQYRDEFSNRYNALIHPSLSITNGGTYS